jgi:TM2 domain-containing membrane protein YozV
MYLKRLTHRIVIDTLMGMTENTAPTESKSKVVAGLLGILLPAFGAHRFYLGDTKGGVIRLVVSFVTLGIGALWSFIEGIMILVNGGEDAAGNPLV